MKFAVSGSTGPSSVSSPRRTGTAQGVAHEGFFGTDKIGWSITRADIAAFTAAQVGSVTYIGAAPAISN
uniref:hypothetical protein n=1 Tax=Rhodococcus oryzae TaxID=2571143 RepID=UPI001B7F9985|nr:hypothetical protein [Rhodococcus oryzae]